MADAYPTETTLQHLRKLANEPHDPNAKERESAVPQKMLMRFPPFTFERIAAVLDEDEDRTSFIRQAVEELLVDREGGETRRSASKPKATPVPVSSADYPGESLGAVDEIADHIERPPVDPVVEWPETCPADNQQVDRKSFLLDVQPSRQQLIEARRPGSGVTIPGFVPPSIDRAVRAPPPVAAAAPLASDLISVHAGIDETARAASIAACVPFLPGDDAAERWSIAMAAEDPASPEFQDAADYMRQAAELAGVTWWPPT